ncbi:MAG: copper chaperone PCu(A)C [Pseudomonadales bacterium]|nr:copper chaperone PCu(A)C [Pseudomonadales bacterium]
MHLLRHLRYLVLALLLPAALPALAADLTFSDARVRALIPGQDKTVGYVNVRNGGSAPVTLESAVAEGVRAIEFHATVNDNGMMRMRRLQTLIIAPGESVALEPGGRHLMLFGIPELSESLTITFRTADGQGVQVPFRRVSLTGN